VTTSPPDKWRRVKFGDVVRNVNVTSRAPADEGLSRVVGLEHLDAGMLSIARWDELAELPEGTSFSRVFRDGQVLFAKRRAYQRKVAQPDFDGICSGDILVFEPRDDELSGRLLPYIVMSDAFFSHALGTSAGSLSPRTKWSDLARFELALPPREAQERAADLLMAADEWLTCLQHLSEKTREARRALVETQLARHSTTTIELGAAADWFSGGTPSRAEPEYWGGGVPWLSPKDMKTDVVNETQETLTYEGASRVRGAPAMATFIVVRGMILAHTFPVVRSEREMTFNQDVKALVAKDGVLPEYLNLWLRHRAKLCLALVTDSSHGTKRIPTDALQELQMERPAVDEQAAIVADERAVTDLLSAADTARRAVIVMRQALLERVLAPSEAHVY
jgi:type I restriction enzyme, S subunit